MWSDSGLFSSRQSFIPHRIPYVEVLDCNQQCGMLVNILQFGNTEQESLIKKPSIYSFLERYSPEKLTGRPWKNKYLEDTPVFFRNGTCSKGHSFIFRGVAVCSCDVPISRKRSNLSNILQIGLKPPTIDLYIHKHHDIIGNFRLCLRPQPYGEIAYPAGVTSNGSGTAWVALSTWRIIPGLVTG